MDERGPGCEASLYGSSVKGTRREGYLAGDPGGLVEKALEMGISFIGAPMGNLEGAHLPGTFDRWIEGALGMEHLSLKRLSAEGLWGGLLYWGPRQIC
jgi:hypothetical protein